MDWQKRLCKGSVVPFFSGPHRDNLLWHFFCCVQSVVFVPCELIIFTISTREKKICLINITVFTVSDCLFPPFNDFFLCYSNRHAICACSIWVIELPICNIKPWVYDFFCYFIPSWYRAINSFRCTIVDDLMSSVMPFAVEDNVALYPIWDLSWCLHVGNLTFFYGQGREDDN